MKTKLLCVLSVCVGLWCSVVIAGVDDREGMNAEQQEKFLARRTSGGLMGNLSSYSSLLYAVNDVVVHSDSKEANETVLSPPFPDFYKPTWREVFGAVARQTKTSWQYDAKRDYWVFSEPAQPLPFQIEVAAGWQPHDEGLYVGYTPALAPVGLDIYMLGEYSTTNVAKLPELSKQVREAIAIKFAKGFHPDISAKEMSIVKIGGIEALHFKTEAKKKGVTWRQWVLVESGLAIAIVSAIDSENEQKVMPDVQKMIESFKLTGVTPAAPVQGHKSNPAPLKTNGPSSTEPPVRSR